MPNPGLLPTKAEWKQQHEIVATAVKRLRRARIEADGQVIGTRRSTKRILAEAVRQGCGAIVMAADPDRHRIVGDMLWSQEPQRVRRKAKAALVREQIVLVEAQCGQLLDPSQPLAQRVGMDLERPSALDHAPAL